VITLKEWDFKLKLVRTKRGAILHVIEIDKNMFWEIKDNRYTGRLLAGAILEKKEIDEFISDVLRSEEYKKYEDVLEKIEHEQEAEQNK